MKGMIKTVKIGDPLGEKYDSSIHATWIGKYLHSNNAISPSRPKGVNIITKIKLD